MTPRQLAARVRHWRAVLRLDHWEFDVEVVDRFEDSDEAFARCRPEDYYDKATLIFRRDWLTEADQQDLDETVVHELLHAYMRNFDHAIERVNDQLAPGVRDLWEESVRHERENVVERLSSLIVSLPG